MIDTTTFPAARPSRWTAGHIAAIVIGALLALFGVFLTGGGGMLLWADRTQRDAGYVTSEGHHFSTSGAALATVPTKLGTAGVGWLYSPGVLDRVRIRVTPMGADPVFVGIGRSTDVDRYLAGVERTVITEFWREEVETVDGGAPATAPGKQGLWVASTTGSGPQTLDWDPSDGSWTVVIMNADGRLGLHVESDLGARAPALPWIGLGVLVFGAVFLAGGVLLIIGVLRRRKEA